MKNTKIGDAIRIGIFRKNITQTELAKKIGCSPQQVSDWIYGRKNPNVDDFIKLCVEIDIIPELFPGYIKAQYFPPDEKSETLHEEGDNKYATIEQVKVLDKKLDILMREVGKLKT